MESPSRDRAIHDIKATINKHKDVIKGLHSAHALSGCHTVVLYFGIGKGTVIKTQDCHDLSAMGNPATPLEEVIQQVTCFISVFYGMKGSSDMSDTMLLVRGKRMARSYTFPKPVLTYTNYRRLC
jgi:hypothetical protein